MKLPEEAMWSCPRAHRHKRCQQLCRIHRQGSVTSVLPQVITCSRCLARRFESAELKLCPSWTGLVVSATPYAAWKRSILRQTFGYMISKQMVIQLAVSRVEKAGLEARPLARRSLPVSLTSSTGWSWVVMGNGPIVHVHSRGTSSLAMAPVR